MSKVKINTWQIHLYSVIQRNKQKKVNTCKILAGDQEDRLNLMFMEDFNGVRETDWWEEKDAAKIQQFIWKKYKCF